MQKVDLLTQTKSSHSDGPRRKKRPSLLDYSDDEDDDDNERCDMEVKPNYSSTSILKSLMMFSAFGRAKKASFRVFMQ